MGPIECLATVEIHVYPLSGHRGTRGSIDVDIRCIRHRNTVDGRNPKQPPGMYKTLVINGTFSISTVCPMESYGIL